MRNTQSGSVGLPPALQTCFDFDRCGIAKTPPSIGSWERQNLSASSSAEIVLGTRIA